MKILVFSPQYVGDTILVIPFLRELRAHYKDAVIDVVTKNAGVSVLKNCPYINNIYGEKDLKKNYYDKAYILKRSLSAALTVKRLNIKDTIGFGGQFREFILKKIVKYKPWEKHELKHFTDVLKADGIKVDSEKLEYWTNEKDVLSVKKYLTEKKHALIVTSSSTPVKNWTIEGFNSVIGCLNKNGYECFIVGTEKEKDFNDKFEGTTNLCGKLTFGEISALISQMDLVVGIDSGFCHMASAFNKKVIAIFGSTSQVQWKLLGENSKTISLNLPCSPCKKAKKCKKNFACLIDLPSDIVIDLLKRDGCLL